MEIFIFFNLIFKCFIKYSVCVCVYLLFKKYVNYKTYLNIKYKKDMKTIQTPPRISDK